ncbi:hypothetical protein QR98_0083930, partial [Sarcoptes scabiei]
SNSPSNEASKSRANGSKLTLRVKLILLGVTVAGVYDCFFKLPFILFNGGCIKVGGGDDDDGEEDEEEEEEEEDNVNDEDETVGDALN